MESKSSHTPILLYGALRSGSTVLRLILDSHPDIACPGERDFMLDAMTVSNGKLEFQPEALEKDWIFRVTGLSLPATTDPEAAFSSMLEEDAASHDKKYHCLVLHRGLGPLLKLRPDIRIIHLVRDPRDVARSSIGMGWAGNTWYGVKHWIKTETEWEENKASLSEDQVFLLKYEDFLEDPESFLNRLCDFLDVPYSDKMLSYSAESTYEPLDANLAYQWRRKQSSREVALVEHKVADLMQERGYEFSGFDIKPPGPLLKAQLVLQNKSHIWKVRFKRYGIIDPILEAISRKTGWEQIGKGAWERRIQKQRKYMK